MNIEEVLTQAIGEDAANKALAALYAYAEEYREGRPNVHVIIDISHLGEFTWGKRITRFTRAPHDKYDFEDYATNS